MPEAPGRRPGEHHWIAMVTFDLTAEDAERLSTGKDTPDGAEPGPHAVFADERPSPDDPRVFLGLHNLTSTAVGCFTCEQVWDAEVAAKLCPGEPLAYNAKGEPVHR